MSVSMASSVQAACYLVDTSNDVTRQLTSADKSAIKNAATANRDITTCDVSGLTNMAQMFWNASAFNQDIGGWDVSKVTRMELMFFNASAFNQDISGWDVSNVEVTALMFQEAVAFNQDIGSWNVSNVENMANMFQDASAFNQDISGWDVSNVTVMNRLFNTASAFDQDISGWDVSNVTTMQDMFQNASAFNQDISGWDVSNVTDMRAMFRGASAFNQDIGNWVVSNVTVMNRLFNTASAFDQDISGWDVSNVTTMEEMFQNASAFNQDIGNWDVSNVTVMEEMFQSASAFNQDLSNWNVALIPAIPSLFMVNATSWTLPHPWSAVAPRTNIIGPTVTGASEFTITIAFSEPVIGFSAADVTVVNGAKGTFTEVTVGTTYTMVITTTVELGKIVSVSIAANVAQDAAGNGNAAATLEVIIGSLALEFEAKKEVIKNQILGDAKASLQNAMNANANLVRQARGRYIASAVSSTDAVTGVTSRNTVPLNYDVAMNADSAKITSRGNFFSQQGSYDGKARQIFFGDFSVVGEKDGSVTGSFSSKIAWEENISGQMMVGYFVGVEVSHTDIYSSFSGKKRGYGLNVGGYFVNEFADNVFIDGFVSVGTGNNILDMSDDVLDLEGIYQTRSGSIGGAITGVYDMNSYEFRPELAVAVGKIKTLKANFTGRAYGIVDDNLTVDAGSVTIANLTVRPEVRRDLESEYMSSGYTSQLTMAPRLICEWVTTDRRTQDCGSGAELGLMRQSYDGMSQFTGRVTRDYVGSSDRTGFEFKFEKFF